MELTDPQVRGWLTNIYQPGALADPVIRELLRAHGCRAEGADLAVSREARDFLRGQIERLQPRPSAPKHFWRPYRVLVLSYLEGHTFYAVACLMGLSPRQLSREKLRALRLLRAELENP